MEPVRYARWLHRLGYVRQHVRVAVYVHLLESRDEVVEWVRGALLTEYQKRLAPADWERFLARSRQMPIPQLEDERPYFYTNPRIRIWGARPSPVRLKPNNKRAPPSSSPCPRPTCASRCR